MKLMKSAGGELLSKANESGKEIYRFKISDERINRNGWKTITEGVDLSEFKKNPVILFNHNTYSFPVGIAVNVFVEGTDLIADIWFHEESDESKLVKKLVDMKVLKMTSIGIKAIEEGEPLPISKNLKGKVPNWIESIRVFTKSELREISVVPIPANTGASFKKKLEVAFAEGTLTANDMELISDTMQTLIEDNEINLNFNNNSKETDMSLEIENANLKNEVANAKKEIESLQKSNADVLKANEELKAELHEAKKSNEQAQEALKSANQSILENQEKQTALEIDNFIAENKNKIMPKEQENDLLKNKLIMLKKNEASMKIGEKSMYEIEKEQIQNRDFSLLTNTMVEDRKSQPATNNTDYSNMTFAEVLANKEAFDNFQTNVLALSKEKNIGYEEALTIESAKCKQ